MWNVTCDLVRCLGAHYPFIAASDDMSRVVEVEQGEADAIQRAGRRAAYAVVNDEPSLRGFDRWRGQTDLPSVPPRSLAGLEEQDVIAPVAQIGREGQPHVGF